MDFPWGGGEFDIACGAFLRIITHVSLILTQNILNQELIKKGI